MFTKSRTFKRENEGKDDAENKLEQNELEEKLRQLALKYKQLEESHKSLKDDLEHEFQNCVNYKKAIEDLTEPNINLNKRLDHLKSSNSDLKVNKNDEEERLSKATIKIKELN